MNVNQIASAIVNDLFSGNLVNSANQSLISIEQISDEVIETRAAILKEWHLKNMLNKMDMMYAINCIEVDCKDQNKCSACSTLANAKMAKHFEIPQLVPGLGAESIAFIGSTDRTHDFRIYYDLRTVKYQQYAQKFRKRPSHKPFVYIEKTPNENGMFDCWLFDAPLTKYITVIGLFKDPRQLSQYSCCADDENYLEMGALSNEIKNRIIQKKIQLYRAAAPSSPQVVI